MRIFTILPCIKFISSLQDAGIPNEVRFDILIVFLIGIMNIPFLAYFRKLRHSMNSIVALTMHKFSRLYERKCSPRTTSTGALDKRFSAGEQKQSQGSPVSNHWTNMFSFLTAKKCFPCLKNDYYNYKDC